MSGFPKNKRKKELITLLLQNKTKKIIIGNSNGQLGLNLTNNFNIFIPTLIILNIQNKIIQISCGYYHNLILIDDGNIFSFGLNNVKNIYN